MEILISIAAKIAEYTVEPVGQWLCYSFHFSTNIENMKNRVMELKAARDRVQHRVIEAINNVEEIEVDVDMWLTKVDDILRKAEEVLDDEEKPNTSSSKMACPNLKLRHKHSKKAKKIVQEIDELKNCRFDKVSYRPASKGSVTTTNMNYVTFESRRSTVEELMEALVDANINMIGVWGMAGVGKSTLIREVAMKVKEKKLFDEVAIATVTHKPELLRIQGEIADKLHLKLDKETLSGRADLLRERLAKEKILVILDDVWEKLDLNEIGIPYDGCKIVVTSRNRDILSSEMGAQKDFGLEVLPKEEAWRLFEKLSGDSLQELNLRSKAMEVSTACAGLPLALVTVAKALKNKCLFEWEDALQKLQRPAPRNQNRMQGVIYSAIKLSYNHLESPELKSFFLFCAQNQLFSSILYQDVLKKCFGLRLFHGISTLEEARNRTYTLVRSLKDSGLLLDASDTSRCFRMHDLTRDVALLIAYETQNVLMMRGEGLVEWPDEDDMKMCTTIVVFNRNNHELPDRLECPELRCLYVRAEDRECSFKISDTFFKGMRKLKVLDLTYMRLSSLPSSLKLLKNLRTLCLDQCVLGDIAMIGEMKNLEILSLIHSEFKYLPREIGLLTNLRMLDLSNCKKLQVIPANVLSCLILLEELYVGNSFTQWEVEGLNNERASLAELKCLPRLSTLEVHIPDANMMPKDLLFEKLRRYKIFIGDVWDWSDKHENSRVLKLKLNTCNQLESGIEKLFNGIEDLCLDELNGVKSIVYELDLKGFQQLKRLHVQNNAEIKYIIHSRGLVIDDVVFPALKIFSLKNMINLEGICDAQLSLTSFRDIRIMKVEHCEKLKFVFSSSMAKGLSQLQELEIKECNIMQAIVVKEDGELEDRDMILFPQLRHLKLQCLPKLVSFLSTQNSIITDVGEIIHEGELDFQEIPHTGMQPLFNEEVAFPNLETLIISHMPNLKIIWHDKSAPGSFTKVQSMEVQFCESLMNIFQVNMLSRFQSLESLVVEDCGSLHEIFELEGQEVTETRVVTVAQLKKLFMCRLPKLKRVWNKDPQGTFSFPNLQQISVWKCESLKSLFPTSVARCLKQLDDLRIAECGIEEIIEQEEGATEDARFVFPKLTLLILRKLSKLKWFYRGVHTSEWPLLKTLEVSGSNEIKIFATKNYRIQEQDEQSQLETSIQQPLFLVKEVAFPSLKTLYLHQSVLEDIAMIGELRNLEILSLLDSNVEQLPREIGLLTHLRILDLSNCTELKVIPPNVLSCLIQLEELHVGNSFTQWDVEGLNNEKASLAELMHLSRLTTLEVHIPDANMLPKDLLFEKLQRYKILVGDVWDWSDTHENSRALKLKLNTSFHLERWIKMLLNGIENLCLDELEGVKSVVSEIDMTGFQQLKHLHVQNNVGIKYIINSTGMVISDVVFPVLGILSLKNMINLEEICHGQIPLASFRNLSIMKVEHCEKLKFIFSSTIAKGLPQLQELAIQECSIMGAIIIKEEGEIEDRDTILFPQLRHLELRQLPKLVSFVNAQKSVISDAGEIIPECELDFHMPILQEQVVFPNLETLELSSIHSEEILLYNQHRASSSFKLTNIQMDSRFHNLCNLIVKGSGNLKYLLSSSTARFMVQLKYLCIEDCKVMEEVLHIDEEETLSDALFPRLERLVLRDLPILKRFCIDSNVEFPLLKKIDINNCPKLKTVAFRHASSNMEVRKGLVEINSEDNRHTTSQSHINESIVFANLESLEQSLIDLEEKQQNQHWARSFCKITNMQTSIRFQNLSSLGVWGSDSFKYLLSSSIARSMVQLKYLHILNCKAMEEILFIEDLGDEEEEEEIIPKMLFPRLEVLELNGLPILKRFYVGGNIEFKSMRSLIIAHCPKLKTFISKPSNSNTVMTVCKEIKEMNTEEIPRTVAIQPLFSEEVAFPSLEYLEISYVDDLKIIWDNQIPPYSFCKLRAMKVEFCENLMNIFQSDMLTRLRSLENLTITDCGSLQEVFQLQEQDAKETHDVTVIPLKELRLDRVLKLKYVWNKDPQGIFNFPNLNLDSTGLRSKWSDSVPSD